jgi:hypothetical protein
MSRITDWKGLEDAVSNYMKALQRAYPIFFHRFADSRAAGNLISDQPSDFLICAKRHGATFLEAKFSEIHDTLRSSFAAAVTANQLASARLAHRAGQRYLILFYSSCANRFELWPGDYCAGQRSLGQPLKLDRRIITGPELGPILEDYIAVLPARKKS